jgi:hypothetical protein
MIRRKQNVNQKLKNGVRLTVLTDKEQVLGNRSAGVSINNYDCGRGSEERGIEQGEQQKPWDMGQLGLRQRTGRAGHRWRA